MDCSDEKFTDENLNEEGNLFSEAYFRGLYLEDYDSTLCANVPTCYHVQDTWDNYEKLSPVISKRFEEWKSGQLGATGPDDEFVESSESKPWWKFW